MSTLQPPVAAPGIANPLEALGLGGLAGSPAHGAGCLQAAVDEWDARTLRVMSRTTGQIFWVCAYLEYL